ncbi:MAG: DUF1616 domain-containing protein [Solirubrobacterales bacterium]
MKQSSTSGAADLLLVVGLTLLAILALILPIPDAARAVVVAPLVLILPGYTVAAAIFLPGEIDRDTRLVLVVIFSMGVLALGGLVLQTVIPLGATVYALLLVVVSIGCSAVALRRRAVSPSSPLQLSAPQLPGYASIAGLLVATVIGGMAIAIASTGQNRQLNREHFTVLWILPRGAGETFGARIGVTNHAGRSLHLLLRTTQAGRPLRHWRLDLGPNREWKATLPPAAVKSSKPIVATLYSEGRVYRRVALDVGAEL